MILINIF